MPAPTTATMIRFAIEEAGLSVRNLWQSIAKLGLTIGNLLESRSDPIHARPLSASVESSGVFGTGNEGCKVEYGQEARYLSAFGDY